MATTRTRPSHVPSARPAPVPPHRVWPRRLLIGLNIFVAMMIVATASTYGYFKYKFGQIPKIGDLAGVLRGEGDPGDPMNVLFVGSDTRDVVSDEERASFGKGQVSGQRADAIIVLHVDPRDRTARMLSIPRDLWVPIAGTSRNDKINAAFNGGAKQLIATITEALGIPIDHYVQLDFNGFRGLVEAVGGVEMYIPSPVRDRVSGLDIRQTGCVAFDGNTALAWVRSRNFQYMENGKWRTDPSADHGRIQRQQDFIRRVIKEAAIQAKSLNIFTIKDMVNTTVSNVKLDEEFSEDELVALARRFRSLEPDAVEMLTLPTTGAGIRGVSALKVKEPEAADVLARFINVAPPPEEQPPPDVLPSSVGVRVLNGSGVGGQATEASTGLRQLGFNIKATGDADRYGYRSSVIRYGKGQRDKALLLKSKIVGDAQLQEDLSLRGLDLVLITGDSFEGVDTRSASAAASATTVAPSSSAAPATTAPPKAAKATTPPPPPEPEC